MIAPVECYLGLGSNLGDRAGNLARALELLDATSGIALVRTSSVYDTAPVGVTDQPRFLNMVAAVACDLRPRELLDACKDIERRMGRGETFRWGPRNIDIDVLLYGDEVIESDTLTIPHAMLRRRQFVIIPLHEIAPDLILPGGEALAELLNDSGDVRRVGGLEELRA